MPASSTVGMSGADGSRVFAVTAIGLDVAGAHLRQRVRRLVEVEVDLAGDQVLHRRAGAAIVHELEARAGGLLEIDAADVRCAAGAGGACVALSGLALSQAISSLRSFAGIDFLATISAGWWRPARSARSRSARRMAAGRSRR